MRIFASKYPNPIGQQLVAQLPWGHILLLIQKVNNTEERNWYIEQTIQHGWSRSSLQHQLKHALYERQAVEQQKTSNFPAKLPEPQSSLAQAMLKNPYNFDFLGLHDDALERDIEHASISHITKFLLELGKGFAFVGSQFPIRIDSEEFFIDMLFYHLHLRCYVVIELKATKFKPEHAGQLNFYLSAVDDLLRHKDDAPSIGILLCKSRNKTIAEYALKNIEKPIGVSEYQLLDVLPNELENSLPSIEEIEAELNDENL
jgi:predicted nuclease of restriction endonuclease-like (RecB) superfamily